MHKDDFDLNVLRRYVRGTYVGNDPYKEIKMLGTLQSRFIFDVEQELQVERGFKDEYNTAGAWVCYIVNYVSRWAMPATFDTKKYTFYRCMIKTAALCCSAAVWFMKNKDESELETVENPKRVVE